MFVTLADYIFLFITHERSVITFSIEAFSTIRLSLTKLIQF